MKETTIMKFETRTNRSKGANNLLRRNGYLPGNIYGKGLDSIPVAVKKDEFRKSLNKFGRNSVFKLEGTDEKSYTVMVREIQIAPVLNEYSHVDFEQVSLSEEVKTDVSIKIIGIDLLESKRLLLNRHMDMISVVGLPQNVPDTIEIDVANLLAGDNIQISDIKFPEGITSEIAPEQVVLSISEFKAIEEVEEVEV